MINKLRQNYQLSNVLIRMAFVLTYVFYAWHEYIASAYVVSNLNGVTVALNDSVIVATAILASLLLGIVLMFLVPVVTNLFLNTSRFYNVPRAEYALLAHSFCTLYFLFCGVLKLTYFVTPLLYNWGGVLFPFFTSLGCLIWFYHVTSKLYFNDLTRPYYFRNMAIVYFVLALVLEVLL